MPREAVTYFEYLQGKRGALERKPSRAAIRDRYGSSRIDASAPQSQFDTTPSGLEARLKQSGRDDAEVKQGLDEIFKANFGRRLRYAPTNTPTELGGAATDFKDRLPNAAAGFTAAANLPTENPVPINPAYQPVQPPPKVNPWIAPLSAFGSAPAAEYDNPTPLSFNLSTPSPLNAASLVPYASPAVTAYAPPWKRQQKPPGSYMATVLNGADKYLT